MTDVTVTTQAPPLANSPDARTPDGTIKDQGTPPTNAGSSPTPPDGQTPPKTETPPKSPTDGKTAVTDTGKPPEGAPEAYADFKAPDGYEIDKAAMAKALPIFKELNLSQDGAQKLVDFYSAVSKEAAEAPLNLYANMQKDWRDEASTRFGKAIEPGGAIVTEFATAIDGLLSPSLAKNFRAALDFTGVGNHPDFIEGFRVFAKALQPGTHVSGKAPSPGGQTAPGAQPKTAAQRLYPHLPSANG